jgi:hypothetical protein
VSPGEELERLFVEDQADRDGDVEKIDWTVVQPRDEARQRRVGELLAAGAVTSAADYYHAAMVYQHAPSLEDSLLAALLAERAASLDPSLGKARWLAAAAKDRGLMRLGLPQRYGTQFNIADDGAWILWDVDPTVTDDERAAWNVPTLAENRARGESMRRR